MLQEKFKQLYKEYDKLQNKYGDKTLDSIYNGGDSNNPDILFVFMNPTGRNIASLPNWVSSIVLNQNISVSQCRKQNFLKIIAGKEYKVYPVCYPIGNGMMNIEKAIEDNL